ncbi:NAD(P)H-dependent oxidoreductase [Butyricicoccus faecihominis]|uniref:NAD(P)H-dependent oxidoreductase n=1 Tax=Butyricicoccaceae TaxID=3085642 RepID=UPI002479C841|nr:MULTISPECIES: NAD(P)H-dependent oxidoreductase [Butyricicoccaceae]MCQ5130877.1 NAD(P)H-dependent oxidoreductase [Butyricicoccus faecihominis]MCQ5130906.1 NAD(P)H-dependent oxidoreductase [Butyricicoccus faecihominis]WNX84266.1 hypothetical protein RWV98_17085 [Agathobaculum sp. NTUH-O15-33]
MKIVMLSGSPRPKRSTSLYLLDILKDKLAAENEITMYQSTGTNLAALAADLSGSDVFVIACPLYVDGVPSNLLQALSAVQQASITGREKIRVYTLVNNGFYDAAQNSIAIDILWNWCDQCGFQRGCAVGIGAGEMVQMAPMGHGPLVNLGKAIDRLVKTIEAGSAQNDLFVEPNLPRFLYKLAAHYGWRKQAKENGLKSAAIRKTE